MQKVEEVQQMSSESDGDSEQFKILHEIIRQTNISLEKYGYGCVIHELNLPIVQPTGALAEAVRQKELNEAKRDADIPAVEQEVRRTTEIGMAEAKVRKAIADASGGNIGVHIEEGMKGLQPGATFVLGNGVLTSLPLQNERNTKKQ